MTASSDDLVTAQDAPTTAPSRSTMTVSAPSTTSSSSEEMSSDRHPLRGELADERLDLRLGADVDPARRIVEEQDARVQAQHAREQDLLLVAPGQLADPLVAASTP